QTQHAGRRNLVGGGDLSVRLSPSQSISSMFLSSQTRDRTNDTSGNAAHVSYSYETRRFEFSEVAEHYDRDFQMDTAFYNQTGFSVGTTYGSVNLYPHGGKGFWLQRVTPFVFSRLGHDEIQDG